MTLSLNADGYFIEAAGLERAWHVAPQQLRIAAVHNTKSDREHRMTRMMITNQLKLCKIEVPCHAR